MSKRRSFPEFPVIMYGVAETPWPAERALARREAAREAVRKAVAGEP